MSKIEQKIEETMQRGGLGFWLICLIFSIGFYSLLWLLMALGSAIGQ